MFVDTIHWTKMDHKKCRNIPLQWLQYPRKANRLILNKFLAFKTPLSSAYNNRIPEQDRFSEYTLFENLSDHSKPTLWIDLTSTTFYDRKIIEEYNCQYIKLQCQNDDRIPSQEEVRIFIQICVDFTTRKPLEIIGIHCIDGLNKTGFFIVSYLVETAGFSINDGLNEFASARPPGIYNDDYIQELYRRYNNSENASPYLAIKPSWYFKCRDLNNAKENEVPLLKSRNFFSEREKYEKSSIPVFMADVPNVTPVLNQVTVSSIQKRIGQICAWDMNTGFPGTQPTFLNKINIRSLELDQYRVSWISKGTR
jgi:mRNA-capping enzyme